MFRTGSRVFDRAARPVPRAPTRTPGVVRALLRLRSRIVNSGRPVVIVAAARSPFGRRGGALAGVHPVDLGATVVEALLAGAGCDPAAISGLIVGCASPVGEQALGLARHVGRAVGLGDSVPGTTVDTQCTSGLRAVQLACDSVGAGAADVVVAGGLESMSRVPFGTALLLGGDPFGARLAEGAPAPVPQGVAAERAAERAALSRDALDEWAQRSHERVAAARAAGIARREIVSVNGVVDDATESGAPAAARLAALSAQAPSYEPGGVVTAGNSAPIADGAAIVLVAAEDAAATLGLPVLARVAGSAIGAGDPAVLGSAAAAVAERALTLAGMSPGEVDRFEVGEQFAVVPLAWAQAAGAPLERVNVHGGAIALGHPVGATGAQLVVTLAHSLQAGEGRRGLVAMAGADGGCSALVLEAPEARPSV
jgi:acetyl-CoA acyltransferase